MFPESPLNMVLDDKAYNQSKQIFLSNDTINSRIVEMLNDIKIQLTLAVTSSALLFALRLNKSTDVASLSQLLLYICYVFDIFFSFVALLDFLSILWNFQIF